MDQGTMAATHGEAKRLATEATNAIKVRVAGLKRDTAKDRSTRSEKEVDACPASDLHDE